jgi:hypothetical protein
VSGCGGVRRRLMTESSIGAICIETIVSFPTTPNDSNYLNILNKPDKPRDEVHTLRRTSSAAWSTRCSCVTGRVMCNEAP